MFAVCGRGGGSNNHLGNESFRELVNEVKMPYVNCPKREKPLIARRIVEAVRNQTPPGRFLAKDPKTGLWNDIGDGKAREKTSQALREGAPVIRDMIDKPAGGRGRGTGGSGGASALSGAQGHSTSNVADVLKEAKKAERAEKEYGVNSLANQGPSNRDFEDDEASLATLHATREELNELLALKRAASMGAASSIAGYGDASSAFGPSIKKYRSDNGHNLPAAWPHHNQLPQGRNFGALSSYQSAQQAHHPSRLNMGAFGNVPPIAHAAAARYHHQNEASVPLETVRKLLLGQLSPVSLAMQILPPEEAAIVAHRHAASVQAELAHLQGSVMGMAQQKRGRESVAAKQQSLLTQPINGTLVSEGSSASTSTIRRASGSPSSVDTDPKRQSSGSEQMSTPGGRALPKKKRPVE